MLFIVLIPIFFALSDWSRRRLVFRRCSRMLSDLSEARQLVRASILLPCLTSDGGIFDLARNSTEQGMTIGSSFTHAGTWMRLISQQAQKLVKISALWSFRLVVLVLLVSMVRIYLAGNLFQAINGVDRMDRLLVVFGSGFLVLSSCLFLRLIPEIEFEENGVIYGMSEWLQGRIAAENGVWTSTGEIQDLMDSEIKTGLSRYDDKNDKLDGFWIQRLQQLETLAERAFDLMPLAEFAGFGLFVVGLTAGPVLGLGF